MTGSAVDTYTVVEWGTAEARKFLRRILREGTGFEAWALVLRPEGEGLEVKFSRRLKGEVGDPEVEVNVFLRGAPVYADAYVFCSNRTAEVVYFLLDGWTVRLTRASGSQATQERGMYVRHLEAEKNTSTGPLSVSLGETIFEHGKVILDGSGCRELGEVKNWG